MHYSNIIMVQYRLLTLIMADVLILIHHNIMHISGERFSDNCVKSDVRMDDVLTGVIIDGVLGIDMNVTDEFKSQMDAVIGGSSMQLKKMAQVYNI